MKNNPQNNLPFDPQAMFDVTASVAAEALAKRRASPISGNGVAPLGEIVDKSDGSGVPDLATQIDRWAEDVLIEKLSILDPAAGFWAEESRAQKPDTDSYFVIDPIDGTNNMINDLGLFAVNVAYVAAGNIEAAATAVIPTGELITSIRGGGCFYNGQRVSRPERELKMSILGMGVQPRHLMLDENIAWHKLSGSVRCVRVLGSLATEMAYTAVGKIDLWVGNGQPWDVMAGKLHIQESGALLVDVYGYRAHTVPQKIGLLMAGSGAVVEQLQKQQPEIF